MRKGGARRTPVVFAVIAIAAVAALSPLGTSRLARADAAASTTALSCSASSASGTSTVSQQLALDVTGVPTQSLPGKSFDLAISDPGETLPVTLQGYPVTGESDLSVAYPVPAGATLVSASLSGGSNVGTGATVTEVADSSVAGQTDIVETVPGPILAGQTFSLPTINLTVTASTTVGTIISTNLLDEQPASPSSVSTDPAVTATVQVDTSGSSSTPVNETCWPTSAAPTVLSSTTVVFVDTTPPAISLTSPVNGDVYTEGQTVDAAYSCSDVASYGISTCDGPAPNGSAIDTSTTGEHTFTVTATDEHGTPAQQSVAYYVKAVPASNVIGPTDAGTVSLTTGASCSFGGSGCPVPGAPEATYEVNSPVPNGGTLVMGDTFTVQWQIFEPGGYSASGAGGPGLSWTVPAPSGGVIDGPVTTSATGLDSPTVGEGSLNGAGACTDPTCSSHDAIPGILDVNGVAEIGDGWTYNAVNETQLLMTWSENSTPAVGTDGLYLDVSYTVKATSPGTLTLPGFSALASTTGLATAPLASPSPAVSFTVADPDPPSATILSPIGGSLYDYGQTVDANFTCSDPVVVVTSCVGTVADGAPIDTTSITPHNLHVFTVTATDSVGNTASTEVEYYVQATAPVVNPQSFSVAWGASATLPVLSNATTTDYPIDPTSVTIVSQPSDGTATPNPDGTVTFTDNPTITYLNYVHSGNLNDSFTYEVSDLDGNVSNVTTVSLTVLPQLITTSLPSNESQGLTLQQPQAQPVESLGSSCGGSGVTLNGSELASCGGLAPVTIINDGPANTGWSLSGQISDFVDPSAAPDTTCDTPSTYNDLCIPGGDLGWTPSAQVISVLPGTGSIVTPGQVVSAAVPTLENPQVPEGNTSPAWVRWPTVSAPGAALTPPPGLHDEPQVLCQSPTNASEGWFVCGASLSLPVPASTAASSGSGYQATLTLTLTLS